MNRGLELIRDAWIGAQISAPPVVRQRVIPRLHEFKELVRLVAKPYLPVYELSGQGAGGPLTVTCINLEFSRAFLESILFVEEPERKQVGQVPFWWGREAAEGAAGDLVIVEAPKHMVRRLPRDNALVMPEFVHHTVDVTGDWQALRSRFHPTVRRTELRWVRKYGYEYELSHDERDFAEFYDEMYLPTMRDRHGRLAWPMSRGEALQRFKHGWLLRILRDGRWVSGVMCEADGDLVIARILGVRGADPRLIHEGAASIIYYACIHWANQQGYRAINFLGTEPFMELGRFQQKRKWGSTVSVPATLHRQLWIRVRHVTPAVARFLKDNPSIIMDENGQLHGLVVVDDPQRATLEDRERWETRYTTPGLGSPLIRSVRSFEGPAAIPLSASAGVLQA